MAHRAAEASGQESLDEFQGERRSDRLSSQTEDIHVVIFNALMGGENVMDKPGTHAGILFAATAAPTPLPQSATPRSTSLAATALAKGMMKSG